MEEITVHVPGMGKVKAIPFVEMPVNHVLAFMTAPDDLKGVIGYRLFEMAVGSSVDLTLLSFRQATEAVTEWSIRSMEWSDAQKAGGGSESSAGEELDFYRLLE